MRSLFGESGVVVNEKPDRKRHIIDLKRLPVDYPTQRHDPAFWEHLGRTVATFGFLEEVLGKAIFSFTGTKPYAASEVEAAYAAWLPKLEHALTDALGNLINNFGKAVREHPDATIENLDDLLSDLKKASDIRNVLCHGSWRLPNDQGASVPFYVNTQKMIIESAVDIQFLKQTQRYAAKLACAVVNTVTRIGRQFPGSSGPGEPIYVKGENP